MVGKSAGRLKVALIDAGITPELQARSPELCSYSNRVSSITSTNYDYLRTLAGQHDGILNRYSSDLCSMRVWDRDSPHSCISFESQIPMGRIIENNSIIKVMSLASSADVYEQAKVTISKQASHVTLTLPEQEISCNLVVGADGKNSVVRSLIKPSLWERPYNQKGLVATVRVKEVNGVAFQRFLRTGPFALLPLDKDVMSVVWTLPNQVADALLKAKLDKDTWLLLLRSALNLLSADVEYFTMHPNVLTSDEYQWRQSAKEDELKIFSQTLPTIEDVNLESLAAFPLSMCLAQHTVASRAIIVGDAAHVIHPLAGQGVNLGIADVRDLARVIGKAAAVGADFGDPSLYELYEKKRLAATAGMSGFVDSVHRVFDSQFPLPYIRSKGMQLFDKMPLLKNLAIKATQL